MAEINNSLAAQVNSNPIDLSKTLGTISQIQLAQAHAGLYGLQAQQEARKLAGFDYLKSNPTDYQGAIQRGLDPSVGSTLQTMSEKDRAYGLTPGGVSPESYNSLTSAQEHRAKTAQIGAETDTKAAENKARIAQGYLASPSDENWSAGINAAYSNGYVDKLNAQRLLSIRDPRQREQAAQSWVSSGVAPNEYVKPVGISPTERITTPGALMRPPVASSNRVMGDREAVQGGLYEPTPAEAAKGWAVAPPASRVGQTFGAVPPAMTPGQLKESEAYGGELAKALPALAEKADNARNMNFTLDQMKKESETWSMGKGGTAIATAQQYLKPIANAFGNTSFDKPVADFESFQKNAGTLVRQAVKEVSPRAAVQEFQLIQGQLPSADMSRNGFNQIVDQFQAVNDYNIAKHQAGQVFRDATGTMDKFDADWNKNITPSAFLVARLPADQLGALRANLQRTPEGRATLKSLKTQLQWAHDHNLDAMVK